MLLENQEIINEKDKDANVFNSYFESVTESLDLFNWAPEPYNQANVLVEWIIKMFLHHHSYENQNIKILRKKSF